MTQEDEKKSWVDRLFGGCGIMSAFGQNFGRIGPLHEVETVAAFFRKFLDYDASEQKHDEICSVYVTNSLVQHIS